MKILLKVLSIGAMAFFAPDSRSADLPKPYKDILAIRLAKVELTDARIDEVIEFLRIKIRELDPYPDPRMRGVNIVVNLDPESIPLLSYAGEDKTIEELFAAIASSADVEIHITLHAIFVTKNGGSPFPNYWARTGQVFRVFSP